MKIPDWPGYTEQHCKLGRHVWSVSRIIELSKDLEIFDIPLDHLHLFYVYERLTLRQFAMHVKAVNNADLSFPIILDEDGEVMDGRHRILRAMLTGKTTIRACRFDTNPPPCRVEET